MLVLFAHDNEFQIVRVSWGERVGVLFHKSISLSVFFFQIILLTLIILSNFLQNGYILI